MSSSSSCWKIRGGDGATGANLGGSRSPSSSFSSVSTSSAIQDESDFPPEVRQALVAVRKACDLTKKVQGRINADDVNSLQQTKQDSSPVTVADYAAQAVILSDLQRYFPLDFFLAEESSRALLQENEDEDRGTKSMIRQIQALTGMKDRDELFQSIDIGQSYGSNSNAAGVVKSSSPPDRLWVLDPIDGTKGFLRGKPNGQYCVALALLEKGVPTVGILACPNLLVNGNDGDSADGDDGERGCIFVACKGMGCYQIGLAASTQLQRLSSIATAGSSVIDPFDEDPRLARFCVGVEQGFNDPFGTALEMGKVLHGSLDDRGEMLHCTRMDSQVKYGVIARGEAEFYVRLPEDHKDNIWDVAAGCLCLEEVGGKVTDTHGNPLDFTRGAKLPTVGILGARTESLHCVLLEAYGQVMKSKKP